LVKELKNLPLLPGWVIRDADGNVVTGREPDTIEFQEIIPGIKPPRVPQLIPELEKLPLLPGWTIRDPRGNVVAHGEPLPTIGGEAETPPPDEHLSMLLPMTLPISGENVIIETESDTEDALSMNDLSDEMLELDTEDVEI